MESIAFTAPWYRQQFFDQNGNPLSGGNAYFYSAGSTAKKDIWLDLTQTNRAPNPMPLNSSGVPTKQYFLESGLYDIAIYNSSKELIQTLYNIEAGGGSGTNDRDLKRYYTWFMMDDSYTNPGPLPTAKITASDIETMLEFGYGITGNTQTTSTTTTSIWYVATWDGTNVTWNETTIDTNSEVINLDRGNCNYLQPHPDRPLNETETYTVYPAGIYSLVALSDGIYWKPLVVKEYPEPTYSVTGALIYDAALSAYRWIALDEIGGKVKVDSGDSTAGYLSDKLVPDNDADGNHNIVFSKIGPDGSNKQYGAHVDTDVIYDEILTKMNPPSYDLFGAYPDEVGVCQLTGIGASLKAKDLKDSNGNPLAWAYGTGQNGANYGRSCIPGYAYVKNAQGTQVKKRVWCAFGSTGEIYNSFDRYNSTTRDTSLITADSLYSRIPMGDASCAAYILDSGNYYWMYGGFVADYCYLLEDIPANYNDDGTFKSTGWIWTSCPGLAKDVSHICSVVTGGFLFTGYHLGGINYKASVAGASVQSKANPPRTNPDYTTTITANGYSFGYTINLPTGAYYTAITGTASDHTGPLSATYTLNFNTNATVTVVFAVAPPEGDVITVTISSTMHDPTYDGAGLYGLGTDHYGTYNVIDRDTGRIYTNTSEYETGTFNPDPSKWSLLEIFVRNSDKDNYPTTKVDRLGSTWGIVTGDPYTWWSSIRSAYGLWVATVALKQAPNDPLYAYSDDGLHWTKYTDGVGTGTGSTLAIWDSQSDGLNWFVTNMYASSPLIFELLVDSIPSHKRLVAEKGIGISGDAFLVDLPSTPILGTDENGKIIPGTGSAVGALTNLDDLKNVSTASKTDGQLLYWNLADGKWEPKTVTNDHLVISTSDDTIASQLKHKIVDSNGTELSTITNSTYGLAVQVPSATYMGTPNGQQLFDYSIYETTNSILYDGTSGTGNSNGTRGFAFIANISRTFRMGYIFVGKTGGTYIRMGIYDGNGALLVKSARVPMAVGIIKCPLNLNSSNVTIDGAALTGGVRYYMAYWIDDTTGNVHFGCLSGRNTSTAAPLTQLYDYVSGHEMEATISTANGSNTAYRPWMMISEAAS